MAEKCLAQVQACRLRIAKLDANGVPHPGAGSMVTTKSLSRLTLTAVYTDGDEIEEKNACGEVEAGLKANDTFKRVDFELELLKHDPYLLALLSGGDVLTDGDAVGFAYPPLGLVEGDLVSVEVWAKRVNQSTTDQDFPYAWWSVPLIKNLRIGDRVFENAVAKPVLTGQAYENANWYDGPLNDWPVASDRVAQWIPTASLPDDVCGLQTIAAS